MGTCFAQTSTVFDTNCKTFATDKKNILVKGRLESNMRTERYFNWDNITPTYKEYLDKVTVLTKKYPGLNPEQMYLKENKPVTETDTFKSYCIESIAKRGMQEELDKWSVHAQNCMNAKYRQRHPDHGCDQDMVKKLNYLGYHAQKLAKLDGQKSPAVRKFYQDAYAHFSQFANNLEALIKSQQDAIKREQEKERQRKQLLAVSQTFDKCREVVDEDGNDIHGRALADKVMSGLADCGETSYSKDTLGLLIKDMKKISAHVMKQHLYEELNQESLGMTLDALWATAEAFGQVQGANAADRKNKLKKIACGKNPKLCEEPQLALLNKLLTGYVARAGEAKVKKITPAEINQALKDDFNAHSRNINALCLEAKKKVSDAKAKVYGFNKIKFDPNKKMDFTPLKTPTRAEMEGRLDTFYREKRGIMGEFGPKIDNEYNKMIQSRFGPLLLSEDFRKKVGGRDTESCFSDKASEMDMPSRTVSAEDFAAAQNDYSKLIQNELSDVTKKLTHAGNQEGAIKDYLKTHPETISNLLSKNPDHDYALLLCRYIREINSSDKRKQVGTMVVTGVGVVAAGALAMTGVGAPAAPALMAVIGTATAVEVGIAVDTYRDNKKQAESSLSAGATGQMNFELAIREHSQWNANAGSQLENIVIIIGAEAAGFGIGKLLPMISKLKNARMIKSFTKGAARTAEFDRETLKLIKAGLEKYEALAKQHGLSRNIAETMTSEELMELGALFSRLDDDSAKFIAQNLKGHGPTELSRLLDELAKNPEKFVTAGKVNKEAFEGIIAHSKKERLPGGMVLEEVQSEIESIAQQIHNPTPPHTQFTHSVQDKLGKAGSEQLSQYIDNLPVEDRVKLLNALEKNKGKTLDSLSKINCIGKSMSTKCLDEIKELTGSLPNGQPSLKGLGKIDQGLEKSLKEANLSQLEINHLKKNLPDGKVPAHAQKDLAEYVEFLSSRNFNDRMKGMDDLKLILQSGDAPKKSLVAEFRKLQKEALKREAKWTEQASKRLKEDPKVLPEEVDNLARQESALKKVEWQKRAAACRSGTSNPYSTAGFKKFDRFNVIAGPTYNAANYILSNLDKDKDAPWFKALGWEVVTSIIYGKIPGYVMKDRLSSGLRRTIKENGIGFGIGMADSFLYTHFISSEKNQKELEKKINDPEFKASLGKLNERMNELITQPEFDQIIAKYQDEITELNPETYEEEYNMEALSVEEFQNDPELQKLYADALSSAHPSGLVTTGNDSYDRFLYNTTYSFANAPKRILVYKVLQRQLCMGNYGAAIALFSADRLFSGQAYYHGREQLIGQ